ncbi:MAG TPA: TonB-dependent receptor plug domain-containing protein, partial [Puia sp.]|nr:TonB-dependent receptor plug domain-containing protein [Puia sp.]
MPTKQKRGLKAVCLTATTMIALLLCLDTHAQDPMINLIHGNMRAKAYIDSIEKEIKVGYGAEQIDTAAYIHAPGPVRLSIALQLLMEKFHLRDTFMGNPRQVYLRFLPAETKTPPPPVSYPTHLTLTVTDEYGRPLPSANLKDSLSDFTYHTSENGTVLIKSSQKQVFLIVTYVGMNPQRVMVRGHVSRTIRLHDGSSIMDEKIVTNYGMGTRRNSTTDITTAPRNLIDAVSTLTPQTGLEGIVPGLLVTRTSGVPGASVFLTIRGQNSIYNNCDPLYVIDGVIFATGNQSMLNLSVGNSGGSLSPFSFIPPSEIEKIDVLKDADATAIYGSRGANGVILITTRRYRSSRPRFTLQYASGIGAVANPIKLLNTSQYLRMRHDAFNYDAPYGDSITPATAPDLLSLDTTRYTNWVKNLLGGVGHTNNIQLAFNQASELDTWYLDLTGFRETGVFPTAPVHARANTCFNFDHHNQKNTWNIHLTGLGGIDDNEQFILLDPTNFIFLAPDAPPLRNPDGSLNFNPYFLNPLSILQQTYKATSYNYLGSAQFKYNPFSWLTLRTELGLNSIGNHETGQIPISAQDPVIQHAATGYFACTSYTSRIIEPQAEAKQQWGRLATGFLLGYSWQDERAALDTHTDTNYKQETDSTYPSMDYQYRAWFARLNFNYDDIFILNLTGRQDGSSRFGPGIHYADFYAVGAAFLFSRLEAVRNTLPWLSLGKLRGSIGVTGNDQIGDHRLQGYTPVNEPSFDNIPGYFSSSQVAVGT